MDAFLHVNAVATITEAHLRGKNERFLRKLAKYTPGISLRDAEVELFLSNLGFQLSDADITFVNTYCESIAGGLLFSGIRSEEAILSKSGTIDYKKATAHVAMPNQSESTVVSLDPIPHVSLHRKGIQNLCVMLCAHFDMVQGKLVQIVSDQQLTQIYSSDVSRVSPAGLSVVKRYLDKILPSYPSWKMAVVDEVTKKGVAFYEFFLPIVHGMTEEHYLGLHTTVCMNVVKALNIQEVKRVKRPVSVKMITVRDDSGKKVDQPFVEKGAVVMLTEKSTIVKATAKCIKEWKDRTGFYPFLLTGPFSSPINFVVMKNQNLKEAYTAMHLAQSVLTGNERGLGGLTSAFGFCGLPSPRMRGIVVLGSIIYGLLEMFPEMVIDVEVEAGDVTWINNILSDDPRYKNVRMLLPPKALLNQPPEIIKRCSEVRRERSHIVWYSGQVPPAVGVTHNLELDLANHATKQMLAIKRDSTVVIPVFHQAFFSNEGRHVYALHEFVSDLTCVYSTISDLSVFDGTGHALRKLKRYDNISQVCVDTVEALKRRLKFVTAPKTTNGRWMQILRGPPAHMRMAIDDEGKWGYTYSDRNFLDQVYGEEEVQGDLTDLTYVGEEVQDPNKYDNEDYASSGDNEDDGNEDSDDKEEDGEGERIEDKGEQITNSRQSQEKSVLPKNQTRETQPVDIRLIKGTPPCGLPVSEEELMALSVATLPGISQPPHQAEEEELKRIKKLEKGKTADIDKKFNVATPQSIPLEEHKDEPVKQEKEKKKKKTPEAPSPAPEEATLDSMIGSLDIDISPM